MTVPISHHEIRDRFSKAMSAMYQAEVPQYETLLELVAQVNRETLERDPGLAARLEAHDELNRLSVERHGAIRVGTAEELTMLRRLFAVMGMYPVGYYDLSEAGVPVHSTAFRPIDDAALARNPFRVFTSLLRLELIESAELRERAADILAERDIFTSGARELIELSERQGGLTDEQADRFVAESLETFRWHQNATVDLETYEALHAEHRLIADVVCFRGPHINHLTPRTLDIDEAQRRMPAPQGSHRRSAAPRLPDPAAPDQLQGPGGADPLRRRTPGHSHRTLRRDRTTWRGADRRGTCAL